MSKTNITTETPKLTLTDVQRRVADRLIETITRRNKKGEGYTVPESLNNQWHKVAKYFIQEGTVTNNTKTRGKKRGMWAIADTESVETPESSEAVSTETKKKPSKPRTKKKKVQEVVNPDNVITVPEVVTDEEPSDEALEAIESTFTPEQV